MWENKQRHARKLSGTARLRGARKPAASMPRVIDVNASMPARFMTVDVVAHLVGSSDGRHSPVPSSGSDSEDEPPPNVEYLRATAEYRCAAAFLRRTPLHWHDHNCGTS